MKLAPRFILHVSSISNIKLRSLTLFLAPLFAAFAFAAPAQASFGVSIYAGNCNTNANCPSPSPGVSTPDQYLQAGGYPPFGISDITFATKPDGIGGQAPDGNVRVFRTDLPAGTLVNNQAVPYCNGFTDVPNVGPVPDFLVGACPTSDDIGIDTASLYGDPLQGKAPVCNGSNGTPGVSCDPNVNFNFSLTGVEVDLDPTQAKMITDAICNCGVDPGPMATLDGVYLPGPAGVATPLGLIYGYFTDIAPNGQPTNYHDVFISESTGTIDSPTPADGNAADYGLTETRLVGCNYGVTTTPTSPYTPDAVSCNSTGNNLGIVVSPDNCGPLSGLTTIESAEDNLGDTAVGTDTPSVLPTGCDNIPFAPLFSLTPSTTQAGAPDGLMTDLTVPQNEQVNNAVQKNVVSSSTPATSNVQNVTVTLPAGMTLNPSAANVLQACTADQFGIGTSAPGTNNLFNDPIACPAASVIGTATVTTPALPVQLTGNLYLGKSGSGAITGPPYIVYLDASNPAYGTDIRVEGTATPDPSTGQLTVVLDNLPDAPASDVKLQFNSGPNATLANPVTCGPASTSAAITPFSGTGAVNIFDSFNVDLNGLGGACASPNSFSLIQDSVSSTLQAGASGSFTFNLKRADNQEYLSHVSTTLPEGLIGTITGVPLCDSADAAAGTCPAASQIGTATVKSGSGSDPAVFTGTVSLTGPYNGAPYGLSIAVPSAIGPFNFGTVVSLQAINVDPNTGQVTVSGNVPTIIQGVPLRIQSISLDINRAGFMHNPTNCVTKAIASTLTSDQGLTQSLSSPFDATGCSSLPFSPSFTAALVGKPSRLNGVGLDVNITLPAGSANVASNMVTLPVQLPSRLTTLQQACTLAVFNANPANCPVHSMIGTATVHTPVLPDPLTGPAILVSHAGAAFPTMTLLLSGDGVKINLVGQINIVKGITSTTFQTVPDLPFTSLNLNLPQGPYSILGSYGNLCAGPLYAPTLFVAQNGKEWSQKTLINTGCKPEFSILSKKVKGRELTLHLSTSQAGRIRVTGFGLQTRIINVKANGNVTIHVYPTPFGRKVMKRFGHLTTTVRVSFTPKPVGGSSVKYTKITMFKATFR